MFALPWYHHRIHLGASHYAAEQGWHLHSAWSRFRSYPDNWFGDGMLTQTFGQRSIYDEFRRFMKEHPNLPTVTISPVPVKPGSPCVFDPSDYIAQVAYDYFSQKGFSHFATYDAGKDAHSRTAEFRAILERMNKSCYSVSPLGDTTLSNRFELLAKELSKLPKPIAFLTPTDDIGAELILAAKMAGFKVPHEIAVLGVHNDELVCESTVVPLSSIDCGLEQMGYEAAKILDKLMAGEEVPPVTHIKCAKVVTRASTNTLAIDNPKVLDALEFIHSNFQREISIEDIAKAGALSVSGLQYLFKTKLSVSPLKEVTRMRLNHARNLLLNKHWPVEMIAKDSGFHTVRNFYRAFQKKEGMSPDAYRKKYQLEMR